MQATYQTTPIAGKLAIGQLNVHVGGVANGGPKTVSKQSNGIADQAKRAAIPTISLKLRTSIKRT